MFKTLGLFDALPCPVDTCDLPGCLFQHPPRPLKKRKIEPVIVAPVVVEAKPIQLTVKFDPSCKIPHETRLHFLRLFHAQYQRIYAELAGNELLANEHAIAQENQVLSKSTKLTYKSSGKVALTALQKRDCATDRDDTGIYPTYLPQKPKTIDWNSMVHSKKTLRKWGFIVDRPDPENRRNDEGTDRCCDRCDQRFIVSADPGDWLTCTYHHGRPAFGKLGGQRVTSWTCCTQELGCSKAKSHVFKVTHGPVLAGYRAFEDLPITDSQQEFRDVVALDCEMVYTTAAMELARVSVLDKDGKLIMDQHILPQNAILDLNTRYSGITTNALFDAIPPCEILSKFSELNITQDTIIIGHGLENDLNALRLIHHRCIDSAILFPHPRGAPYRLSLKFLVKRYLNQVIQESTAGHDPAEDARGALDVIKWKALNGNKQVGDDPFRGKLK